MDAGYVKDEEPNFEALVFSDNENGFELSFQRVLRPTEQDRDSGTDSHCLTDVGGRCVYDAVVAVGESDAGLTLEHKQRVAHLFRLEGPPATEATWPTGTVAHVAARLAALRFDA